MKLSIPIEVEFDNMNTLIDDLGHLQTYKLSADDEMTLVDIADVADTLAKHVKAREIKRKTGRWIDIDSETYTWKIRCDKCGYERSMLSTQGNYPKFCEGCGADMRGEDNA